ncbi:uncharacterized protein LOC106880029 [Octopus bimaculoides]|uniref:uncharacterized protein LOC106880029 n=1 Tax=Octopus bimaculoides TaxID=37653 RepID=UPI0022DEBDFF|nr:uncharacterized protein LOC106880029 [Octopus bimaculoides]
MQYSQACSNSGRGGNVHVRSVSADDISEYASSSDLSMNLMLWNMNLVKWGKLDNPECCCDRDTAIGSVIDKYLKKEIDLPDQAIHLLFTANRWETMKDIQKMLLNGVTVIMDRYAYSGICYSVAKGTLSLLWCKAPDRGIIKPDCIFFLDLSPLKANRRAGFGEERYEVIEFQEKVRDQFLKIKDNSWKSFDYDQAGAPPQKGFG